MFFKTNQSFNILHFNMFFKRQAMKMRKNAKSFFDRGAPHVKKSGKRPLFSLIFSDSMLL